MLNSPVYTVTRLSNNLGVNPLSRLGRTDPVIRVVLHHLEREITVFGQDIKPRNFHRPFSFHVGVSYLGHLHRWVDDLNVARGFSNELERFDQANFPVPFGATHPDIQTLHLGVESGLASPTGLFSRETRNSVIKQLAFWSQVFAITWDTSNVFYREELMKEPYSFDIQIKEDKEKLLEDVHAYIANEGDGPKFEVRKHQKQHHIDGADPLDIDRLGNESHVVGSLWVTEPDFTLGPLEPGREHSTLKIKDGVPAWTIDVGGGLEGDQGAEDDGPNGGAPFTPGSVVYIGPNHLAREDNDNFYWDFENKRLSIGDGTREFRLNIDNQDGSIISRGSLGDGDFLITSGEGVRLIWYARKGAFMAGRAIASSWDDENIGELSISTGDGNSSSGDHSTTIGGQGNEATGDHGVVIGGQTNVASGFMSSIIGGSGAVATGFGSHVSGGLLGISAGLGSNVLGGNGATASSFLEVALGQYNDSTGDPHNWINTDYLMSMGDGVSEFQRDNVFTFRKDGLFHMKAVNQGFPPPVGQKNLKPGTFAPVNRGGLSTLWWFNGQNWAQIA